jgi:hypothetical protein
MRLVPLRYQAHCHYCGDDVDIRRDGVCQRQVGWVPRRHGGGANHIRHPEKQNLYACELCMDKLDRGGGAAQLALFGG